MYRKIFTTILFLSVSACATSPVQFDESKPVPKDRTYSAYDKYSLDNEKTAKVIVVRDRGTLGAAGSASLFLNGEIVARLRTSESIVLYVPFGDNVIGAGPGTKMEWEPDSVQLLEQTLYITENKTYFFRLGVDPYKGLVLHRSTQLQ